jgi:beta-aspartyl-peptidase (threonine type)
MHYVLAIHGGAGTIMPGGDEAPYHQALKLAAQAGETVLAAGGSALDAVSAAVVELENCILFNAGRGSVYTSDAVQEMDAIVMDGKDQRAGAVAGVCSVQNPVLLARAVMEQSNCVLLMGQGAERFAREQGFAFTPPDYFASQARLDQLHKAQAKGQGALLDHDGATANAASARDPDNGNFVAKEPINPDTKFGTVGAVARDRMGNLASAVSTGGMTNKRPGRVGDTPIVGAGCYANNASVAVAATGTGEHFIRSVLAHDVAARMEYGGVALAKAAHAAVHHKLSAIGGEGGIVAIGMDGSVAMPFNTTGMYRASVREGEAIVTAIFA